MGSEVNQSVERGSIQLVEVRDNQSNISKVNQSDKREFRQRVKNDIKVKTIRRQQAAT